MNKQFCDVCGLEIEYAQIRMSLQLERLPTGKRHRNEISDSEINEYRNVDICIKCTEKPIRIINLVDGTFILQLEAVISTGKFFDDAGIGEQPRLRANNEASVDRPQVMERRR